MRVDVNEFFRKIIYLLIVLAPTFLIGAPKKKKNDGHIVILTYSKDRPLQLYSYLESAYRFLKGDYEIVVMYATSKDDYRGGYHILQNSFPQATFIHQRLPAELKPLTLKALFESKGDYCMLAVDDIIVKDHVNLDECVSLLEQTNAFGFYLRLGKNITECYSMNTVSGLPPLTQVKPGIFTWQFSSGRGEWRYIGTFDMTLYRKKDLWQPLSQLQYSVPNACEAAWQDFTNPRRMGLCFAQSKIVNIPMNLVQSYAKRNRNMGIYTPEELFEKFMDCYKIDILPIGKIRNKAPHMEYKPQFIKRSDCPTRVR
jgi:hypothetical protein